MSRSLGLVLLLSLVAAGCAEVAPPRMPLMSPLSEARTFGYSERSLAADQVEVSYVAPVRDVPLDRAARAAEIAKARTLAEDLALWRAAQVAIARKAAGFQVINRRSDSNLELRERLEGYSYVPYYFRHRRHRPFGYYGLDPYDPFFRIDRDARVQVKATITIALRRRKGRAAFDPRATEAEMRGKYPDALGVPAQ